MTIAQTIFRVGRSNALAAVLSLLVGVLTARWLGPAGRGEYALFFATVGLAATFGQMGFYQAAIFAISKGLARAEQTLGNLLVLIVLNVIVFAILFWGAFLFFPAAMSFLGNDWIGVAFVCAVLFSVTQEGLGGIVMARKHYHLYTDQLAIEPAFIFLMTLPLLIGAASGPTAITLRVFGSFLAILILVLRITHVMPLVPEFRISTFRQEAEFGSKVFGQNVLGLLNYRVYLYFLASNLADAGRFSVALLFCELVRFVPNTVGTALLPFLADDESGGGAMLAARSCRTIIPFSGLIIIFVATLRGQIVSHIFGNTFAPVIGPALILMMGALIGTVYQVLTRYFMSIGRQAISVSAAGLGLAVALTSSVLLIPHFGMEGAAFSYVVSSLVASGTLAMAFSVQSGLSARDFLLLRRDDIHALCGAFRHLLPN